MRVGLVGCGYWGRNIKKVLDRIGVLSGVYDDDPERSTFADFEELVENSDAVVIATPVETHAGLAVDALRAGKHVLVEKPMALAGGQCQEMIDEARMQGKTLMVGHLMRYSPAFMYLVNYIGHGGIGDIVSIHSSRLNLGKIRTVENAAWSLAPHDVSMILALMGKPMTVQAQGVRFSNAKIEDTVHINLGYEHSLAHIHVSWLTPEKVRKLTVVGTDKMVVLDDLAAEKVSIHNKGVNVAVGDYRDVRYGDILQPWIEATQPLENELRHFVACCQHGGVPLSSGQDGLEVIQVLAACDESLANGGEPVVIR